jgi:HlyD family secretion protein
MKSTWNLRGLLFLLVVTSLIVSGCAQLSQPEPASVSEPEPEVETYDPIVSATGKVVPAQWATLSMPIAGTVADLLVQEGDAVEAGAVLLIVDNRRQQAAVAEAQASLAGAEARVAELTAGAREQEIESAKAAVEAAQAQLAGLREGAVAEEIAVADAALATAQAELNVVLEGPDELELVAAQAELDNAAAKLSNAQAAYDKVKWRSDVGASPEALALEQAANNTTAAKARYDALAKGASAATIARARAMVRQAQAELDRVKAPARQSEVDAARAEIHRAEAQLGLLEAGARPETLAAAEAEVAVLQAGLDRARAALEETLLRAPFSGTVASLKIRMGEQVTPGAPLLQLADLGTLQVETTDLNEIDAARIDEGSVAAVTFEPLVNVVVAGRVARVAPKASEGSGVNYTVVVELDEIPPRLRWDMTAFVDIEVAE